MEFSKKLGDNLRSYRKKFGYSQDHLAKLLNVERSTISKFETGDREISIIHLNKMADLYGVELESLIEVDTAEYNVGLAYAFRKQGIGEEDLESIASFQKMIKNYLKMEKLLNENEVSAK